MKLIKNIPLIRYVKTVEIFLHNNEQYSRTGFPDGSFTWRGVSFDGEVDEQAMEILRIKESNDTTYNVCITSNGPITKRRLLDALNKSIAQLQNSDFKGISKWEGSYLTINVTKQIIL